MTEVAIFRNSEILNQTVARLQECVEDLENLTDLEAAVAESAGKPTPSLVAQMPMRLALEPISHLVSQSGRRLSSACRVAPG